MTDIQAKTETEESSAFFGYIFRVPSYLLLRYGGTGCLVDELHLQKNVASMEPEDDSQSM